MRILKWLVGVVALLAVVFLIGAYLLPREVAVQRTASINASPDKIFPFVNSMQATEAWSPWMGRDPEMKIVYEGPEAGVGNKLIWTSMHPQVGNGIQTITASEINKRVATDLDFGEMGTAKAEFLLVESGAATDVTWGFVTDTGMNPVARWMGLMMDRWVGGDYEAGLANLKTLAEGN